MHGIWIVISIEPPLQTTSRTSWAGNKPLNIRKAWATAKIHQTSTLLTSCIALDLKGPSQSEYARRLTTPRGACRNLIRDKSIRGNSRQTLRCSGCSPHCTLEKRGNSKQTSSWTVWPYRLQSAEHILNSVSLTAKINTTDASSCSTRTHNHLEYYSQD